MMRTAMTVTEITTVIRTATRRPMATIDPVVQTANMLLPTETAEQAALIIDQDLFDQIAGYCGGNVARYSCAVALCGVASTL